MKILVTVGTGSFDSLVECCDKISSNSVDEFTFQIGKGGYQPKNGLYFDFSPDLHFTDFDLVISHCGAGTVFKCLNSKIPLIAIPNLERSDKHQSELGCYLEKHNFCCTCFDLTHLKRLIVDYDFKNYNDYNNISFFGVSEVVDIINDSFKE